MQAVPINGLEQQYLAKTVVSIEPVSDISADVEVVNSIEGKYKTLRGESKAPTFALTYQGTWLTLVANCGFSPQKAKQIEEKYHELYVESDKWVHDQLVQATKDGYVTVAFGLRVRTPALASSLLNSAHTPSHVAAEGRTAGNALGQSYGLLNTRAANDFQGRTLASKHRLSVLPVAAIHDANYFLIRNDLETVKWVNDNLVECSEWQELEAIKHDQVKLGGELSIFYPSWREEYVIPNRATIEQIEAACDK